MNYTHDNRILYADSPVTITGDAMRLHAADMTYDLNTNQAQFSGRVKGTVRDDFAL